MATINLRFDDDDATIVRRCAQSEGKTISDFIRDAVFERIEDKEDSKALREAIAIDDGFRYSHAQVLEELGL